jgi:hypothetical protein
MRSWTIERTYSVPDPAPPVVHVIAIADDAVGNESTKDADFPTDGDWYGTLTGHGEGNIYNDKAEVRFNFAEAADGTITGKARAKVTSYEKSWANCRHTRKPPAPFDFAIRGRRVDEDFHLELENPRKPVVMTGTCANGAANTITSNTSGFLGAGFSEAFLRPKVSAQDGATNKVQSQIGDVKVDTTIVIHRVKE